LYFLHLLAALGRIERDPFQRQVALPGDLVDPLGDQLRGRFRNTRSMRRRVLLLLTPGARRPRFLVLRIIPMPILDSPHKIDALPPIMHPAIGVERIVNVHPLLDHRDVHPRDEPQAHIPSPIIVAEIIMAVLRAHP
jgi:hypothetical protein